MYMGSKETEKKPHTKCEIQTIMQAVHSYALSSLEDPLQDKGPTSQNQQPTYKSMLNV